MIRVISDAKLDQGLFSKHAWVILTLHCDQIYTGYVLQYLVQHVHGMFTFKLKGK